MNGSARRYAQLSSLAFWAEGLESVLEQLVLFNRGPLHAFEPDPGRSRGHEVSGGRVLHTIEP